MEMQGVKCERARETRCRSICPRNTRAHARERARLFTVFSTVERNFAAKRRNSVQRGEKRISQHTQRWQRCASRRKPAQKAVFELQISCSNQLSYADAASYESRFSEFIKSCDDTQRIIPRPRSNRPLCYE